MHDFILFMHDDQTSPAAPDAWPAYIAALSARGVFGGGSAIGEGGTYRRDGPPGEQSPHLTGFIRVRADSLEGAAGLLVGNPVFEAGGTVEIRELPRG